MKTHVLGERRVERAARSPFGDILRPDGVDGLHTNGALQRDAPVLDALRMLTDKALSEKARQYAEGALMALLPPEAAVHHEIDTDARHVFVSYQWAVQVCDKLAPRV